MNSATETLYLAACQALQGIAGLRQVHDRQRGARFVKDELPCARVLEGSDVLIDAIAATVDLRELQLKIELYVAAEHLGTVDTWRQECVRRLFADPHIQRLSDWITIAERDEPERDESDGIKARITQYFRIRYPTAAASLIP